jgi:hypothetical protein
VLKDLWILSICSTEPQVSCEGRTKKMSSPRGSGHVVEAFRVSDRGPGASNLVSTSGETDLVPLVSSAAKILDGRAMTLRFDPPRKEHPLF